VVWRLLVTHGFLPRGTDGRALPVTGDAGKGLAVHMTQPRDCSVHERPRNRLSACERTGPACAVGCLGALASNQPAQTRPPVTQGSASQVRDLIGSRRWRHVWQSSIVNRAKRLDRRHLRAARHPTRRDGVIALALLLLPWVVAAVAARRHHHLDAGTVAAVSIGLATLWVAWATFRGPKRPAAPASSLTLGQVADQLAIAAGAQWEAEAAVRRLNDPYPLPLSWGPADASLTDSWESLVKLASSGAGWPAPPPAGTWAVGPGDLAGQGGELAEVLARVPTGRLVVLGEPGAGKTMLMVRLVLDLLTRRDPGGPVPFLAPVASWDPSGQDLRGWLAARLVIDHPALSDPPPVDATESTQAAALLASGLILPVLDGLDEIPDQVRGPALSRINDGLRPGERLVVTCRTQQYRDVVRPPGGLEVTLRAAAAVQVRPLDADAVRDYLIDDAAGPAARARWAPVRAVLGTAAPAAQALGTPLMVGLARTIYNPRPGELAGTLRDPAELCNPAMPDRTAVESLLFDAFIPAAYRHDPGGRWKAQDAEKWLVFLACHLERRIGSPDLAWWQLRKAVPRTAVGLATGLGAGLTVGLGAALGAALGVRLAFEFGFRLAARAGLTFGLGAGLGAGVGAGLVFGLGAVLVAGPAAGFSGAPGELAASLRPVLAGARLLALFPLLGDGLVLGIVVGGLFGLGTGLAAGPMVGLGAALGAALVVEPAAWLLARVGQVALVLMLAMVLATGVGLAFEFGGKLAAGLAAGLMVGLGNMLQSAWPSYMITRGWLALHHRLPWPLMSFLADAHRRGVLRQAGSVYQFRHIELQHRLANRDAPAESRE
jgi:NACHT domain